MCSFVTVTPSLHHSSSGFQESWLPKSGPAFCRQITSIKAQSLSSPSPLNINHDPPQKINGGQPKILTPRLPENVCDLSPINFLERAAVVYRDCPAIVYKETCRRTWSQTHVRCLKLASSIVALGIEKGDVVSVVVPNIPAMIELHFAVPMAGAVLNTVNLRLDAAAISNVLQHAESRLVFVDYQSLSVVQAALELFHGNIRRPDLVLIDEEKDGNLKYSPGLQNYEDLVQNGDPGFKWIKPDSEWDPISLNYTSGTTSNPKGVLHSHRGVTLMSLDSLLSWSVPQRPVYLWTLPLFHANGWSYAWGIAAVGGVHVCLRRVEAAAVYKAIERYKVTHMCGAPTVLNMLANYPGIKRLESPVHLMTAGAPPPAAVLYHTESLGFIVSHGYGLTETAGLVVTCAWKREWDELPATERAVLKSRQGVSSVAFAEMDVIDRDSGSAVPRDGATIGEVVLRGGSLMVGYLKDAAGTAKCMTEDGWFYTGDVGVVHPDGYLEIKDRSKDIIICGGENLSSVEIEAALYAHPAVNEAAVVGRPSEFWGETPYAFVSLKKEKAATEKEIREFCKEKLPLYMVPRTVVFVAELPKTSTGKIQKFALRLLVKQL